MLAEHGLARRRDAVADIGAALVAKAAGAGHRLIATGLGVSAGTVRGWLRRFASILRPSKKVEQRAGPVRADHGGGRVHFRHREPAAGRGDHVARPHVMALGGRAR